MKKIIVLILITTVCGLFKIIGADRIPITIENHAPGAPITMGIPFPLGVLESPDHIRLLDANHREIPCQVDQVTTWEPRNYSVKWVWLFFFAESGENYFVEYGPGVRRSPLTGDRVTMINSQRTQGFAEVDTGPMKFRISKGPGGFMDFVMLDRERNGFDSNDTIATAPPGRGSFLDLLDEAGIDPSQAIVTRTVKEKGSGPLHGILRVEGIYQYQREDNFHSPFILRIHAYAGKSYLKVLHTLTYTGIPDQHQAMEGEYPNIATQKEKILLADQKDDPGWVRPKDQIHAVGLNLDYRLDNAGIAQAGYQTGDWWEHGESKILNYDLKPSPQLEVIQSGPKPDRIPPVPESAADQRIDGFSAAIRSGKQNLVSASRAEGWVNINDGKWGIGMGIRNFLEEYPKQVTLDQEARGMTAYLWSPEAGPMSFARWSSEPTGQMLGNFAQGLTKTSELIYHFHRGDAESEVVNTLNYILDPPVAHAEPQWYADSKVFGNISPRQSDYGEFERGLDYKFDWVLFNQNWAPWYGMFDYGDFKTFYMKDSWRMWSNNEPAQDYMLWLQFVRTGNRKYFLAAEAASRHTMDVDNIHWPQGKKYVGDTNPSLDFWATDDSPKATPYLGIGRRHSHQHWTALLSAHVWVQGWISSYYLSGYHRGLEVARLTAETYGKRIWGDHGLTGRRLYLSVWNLVEIWDATKDLCYRQDLDDRVQRMINFQDGPDQCNSLVMDRYGYAQVYASHGLSKYYQLTQDEQVKNALLKHARSVRDVPPWNHQYESYLSTIHSLLVGYQFSEDESFLREALERAQVLKTDELPQDQHQPLSQYQFATALEQASHMPRDQNYHEGSGRDFSIWDLSQGLRVYGWTHGYNVPYLLYWLREREKQ